LDCVDEPNTPPAVNGTTAPFDRVDDPTIGPVDAGIAALVVAAGNGTPVFGTVPVGAVTVGTNDVGTIGARAVFVASAGLGSMLPLESVEAGTSGGNAVFVAAAGFGTRLTLDAVTNGTTGDTGIEGKFVFVATAGLGIIDPSEFVRTGMIGATAVFVNAAGFTTNEWLASEAIGTSGTMAESAGITFPFEFVKGGKVGNAAAVEMDTRSPSDNVNPAGTPWMLPVGTVGGSATAV
jgi:hypothetical protein